MKPSKTRTVADTLEALPLPHFVQQVTTLAATSGTALRALSVALFAATARKDCRDHTGASGKGAFAWFLDCAGGKVTKGRFSQYCTYGAWIDHAERAGKPELVQSEYDARALNSAFRATDGDDPTPFLASMDRAKVTALAAKVTESKGKRSGKDDGAPSGRATRITAKALADAIGDMVVAALSRKDTTPELAKALADALRASATLCDGYRSTSVPLSATRKAAAKTMA